MTWVSERHLVAAISNAGGFGVLACGAMTPGLLDAEIEGTRAKTEKPFGVNLIVMHRGNTSFERPSVIISNVKVWDNLYSRHKT